MKDYKQEFAVLIRNYRGEAKALSSEWIAFHLGIQDGPGHPKTRKIVKEAIREFWLPVGATEKGYYWLTTEEELERYLASLRGRIAAIATRIKAVEMNFYSDQEARRKWQVLSGQVDLLEARQDGQLCFNLSGREEKANV